MFPFLFLLVTVRTPNSCQFEASLILAHAVALHGRLAGDKNWSYCDECTSMHACMANEVAFPKKQIGYDDLSDLVRSSRCCDESETIMLGMY
jgi:hypothetical protein